MKKGIKVFIDACMVILLILLFPTAKISPSLHVFLGFALAGVIIIHLLLNGKWLIFSIKNLFSGKLSSKIRYMLILSIGLIIAFTICIMTGIAIYQSNYYSSTHIFRATIDPSIRFMYGLHGASAVACIFISILHVKANMGFIKSFFIRYNKKV